MATLSSTIRQILSGTKTPAATVGDMKGALSTLYDFVTDLLGTDSTNPQAARNALGAISSGGYRNKIRNADFFFNSRGYVSQQAISGNSNNASDTGYPYVFDGWRLHATTGSVSYADFDNGRMLTLGSDGIEQVIDGREIVGGTYALKWVGTASCLVNGSAVANGGSIALTANSRTIVRFVSGTLGKVQMERGAFCGDWEDRDRGLEEVLLGRYYRKHFFYGTGFATAAGNHLVAPVYLSLPVMRVKASVVLPGPTPSDSVGVSNVVYSNGQAYIDSGSGLARPVYTVPESGNLMLVHWTASAAGLSTMSGYITVDAEDYSA